MSIASAIIRVVTVVIFVQLVDNVAAVAAFDGSFSIQHRHASDALLVVLLDTCSETLGNTFDATYRVLPKSTLCLGESVEIFDLFTDTAFQLSNLLWCAGNTRNPAFDGGISNLAGRQAVLELELLNCREEINGLGLVANSAFDPELISMRARSNVHAGINAHLGGSLTSCNLIEGLATHVDNAQRRLVRVVARRQSEYLPSLLLVAVAASVDGS